MRIRVSSCLGRTVTYAKVERRRFKSMFVEGTSQIRPQALGHPLSEAGTLGTRSHSSALNSRICSAPSPIPSTTFDRKFDLLYIAGNTSIWLVLTPPVSQDLSRSHRPVCWIPVWLLSISATVAANEPGMLHRYVITVYVHQLHCRRRGLLDSF